MLQRCYDAKHNRYHRYGARGITVCDEWREYPTFKSWASREGYRKGLTIDRVNGDLGYVPENCLWVSQKDQQRNRVNNRTVKAFGETKVLAAWADDPRCEPSYKELWSRISRGMDPEEAITRPLRRKGGYSPVTTLGETMSVSEWADDPRCEVNAKTLWARVHRGWPADKAVTAPSGARAQGVI
jgi:hypothetical protein